jgi:hypothetical protein
LQKIFGWKSSETHKHSLPVRFLHIILFTQHKPSVQEGIKSINWKGWYGCPYLVQDKYQQRALVDELINLRVKKTFVKFLNDCQLAASQEGLIFMKLVN